MYEHILLPTDGSSCSQLALEHGLQLAKTLNAKVTFISVVENPLASYAVPETLAYNQELYETVKKQGQQALSKAKALADQQGITAETKLLENTKPLEAILEHAKDCDLIVMGTHGRRGFDRWLLGSVAEGVLRHTDKPCLVVRSSRDS